MTVRKLLLDLAAGFSEIGRIGLLEIRVSFRFDWRELWIGLIWPESGIISFCPLPCCVFSFFLLDPSRLFYGLRGNVIMMKAESTFAEDPEQEFKNG